MTGIEVMAGDTEKVKAGRGTADGAPGAWVEAGHPEVQRAAVTVGSEALNWRSAPPGNQLMTSWTPVQWHRVGCFIILESSKTTFTWLAKMLPRGFHNMTHLQYRSAQSFICYSGTICRYSILIISSFVDYILHMLSATSRHYFDRRAGYL